MTGQACGKDTVLSIAKYTSFGKVIAKVWPLSFVIIDSLIEFSFRIRVKRETHFKRLSHILWKTSSPETALTSPERNSRNLRWATSAHCLSISDVGVLRVFSKESTSIALSSTGREMASSSRSVVFMFQYLFRECKACFALVAMLCKASFALQSKQFLINPNPFRRLQAQMQISRFRRHPAPRRAYDETLLDQIRLQHVLNRAPVFANRRR